MANAEQLMRDLAASHSLSEQFPAAVEKQVDAFVQNSGIDAPELHDFSGMPFVSIDGPGTRDLDQALCVFAQQKGYRVLYALADASYYVAPSTPLFAEAIRRGASYYLPGFSVPMLPRRLSEDLVSLNPNRNRRSLVFDMQLDETGRCRETTVHRARIRSRGQLTFAQVEALLEKDDASGHPALSDPAVVQSLRLFKQVGEKRMQEAEQRDVVRYRRIETEVKIDGTGLGFSILGDGRRTRVERYNEQLSLMCNVEGARLLRRGHDQEHVHAIYRVHPAPDRRRYRDLQELIQELIRIHQLDESPWRWQRGKQSLADYLMALPNQGAHGAIAHAIHRQAIMLNVRSTFSDAPGKHHGIGADVYARFSAPMREIVGVFVHKEALELLGADPHCHGEDESLRQRIVERSNEAKALQKTLTKEANQLVLDRFFSKASDQSFTGAVMGMTRGKAHVLLDSPALEVKVYTRSLSELRGNKIDLAPHGASLVDTTGKIVCSIGQQLTLKLCGQEPGSGRWRFNMA